MSGIKIQPVMNS